MDDRTRKFRTGVFISGAVVLLLAMLFYFGMSRIFVTKVSMYTTFSESVQGLSVGSEVKYRGVKIGVVRDISINVEEKLIKVNMDIYPDRFSGIEQGDNASREQQFRIFINREMKSGLRCRLELSGITGMRYIDFDYFAETGGEVPATTLKTQMVDDGVYIASVSSSFKDIAVALTVALERISRVRFENISEEAERVLRELSAILGDPALKVTLERLSEAVGNLERSTMSVSNVVDEKRIGRMLDLLEKNLQNFERLSRNLDNTTKAMQLPESSASFRQTAQAVQALHLELSNSLIQLNEAVNSFRRLCEKINYNPGFLFRGGSAPQSAK